MLEMLNRSWSLAQTSCVNALAWITFLTTCLIIFRSSTFTRSKRTRRDRVQARRHSVSAQPTPRTLRSNKLTDIQSTSQLSLSDQVQHIRNNSADTETDADTDASTATYSGLGFSSLQRRLTKLTPSRRKKTLILDLDETLIHSTTKQIRHHDFLIEVCLYYVYKRPHVDYFLKKESLHETFCLQLASIESYASPVIDWLDKDLKVVSRRFYRDKCTPLLSAGFYKDLQGIEPDLANVCLLDNSPMNYAMHPDNGIQISSWTDDDYDKGLLEVLPLFDALRYTDDVRHVLSLRR